MTVYKFRDRIAGGIVTHTDPTWSDDKPRYEPVTPTAAAPAATDLEDADFDPATANKAALVAYATEHNIEIDTSAKVAEIRQVVTDAIEGNG